MKRQAGFTLIELVIVIIILGLLAATALPRFLNVTEQAEDAAIEGIAGGFAAAVGLTRAQWEVSGRPAPAGADAVQIIYDGENVWVRTASGYPVGRNNDEVNETSCVNILNTILQAAPTATVSFANRNDFRLYARHNANQCYFYQVGSLQSLTTAPTGTATPGKGFTYSPVTGQVSVFQN